MAVQPNKPLRWKARQARQAFSVLHQPPNWLEALDKGGRFKALGLGFMILAPGNDGKAPIG